MESRQSAQARQKHESQKHESRKPRLDRRKLVLRYRSLLSSNHASLQTAITRVIRLARRAGCTRDDLTDVEIALREALANAFIHGNKGAAGKRVLLRCYGGPEAGLLIAIRDEGKGFDPEAIPDPRLAERLHLPHGRGIFLMRALMDHIHHRKGGTEVVLFKRCIRPKEKPRRRLRGGGR